MLWLAVSVLCMLYLGPPVDGCSCVPLPHLQDIFCKADFVIKVKVLSITDVRGVLYGVEMKKVYQGSPDFSIADQSGILTFPLFSACGVFLQVGNIYLLTGQVSDGKLNIDICQSWTKLWNELSLVHKKALKRGKYRSNCAKRNPCTVCVFGCAKHTSDVNKCIRPSHSYCHMDHSHCERVKGRCQFKKSKQLKTCLSQQ